MKKNKHHLFGLIGLTASGKTSLAKYLVDRLDFLYIPSTTTRPPRKGNTKEYKHISVKIFEDYIKNNELLEYTVFAGHYYGKLKKDVEEKINKHHSVYTLTPDQVKKLKDSHEKTKIILIQPEKPFLRNIKKRLKNRGHSQKEISERLKTIEKELRLIEELKEANLVDYVIKTLDNDYDYAKKEIEKITKKYL